MKTTFFVLLIFFIQTGAWGQQIDWSKTANWKIYKLVDREAINISPDSLLQITSIALPADSLMHYLKDARYWDAGKKSVWMGAYLLSYGTSNRQTSKLLVSSYGGFLFDVTSRQYLELADDKKGDWLDFLLTCHEQFNEP